VVLDSPHATTGPSGVEVIEGWLVDGAPGLSGCGALQPSPLFSDARAVSTCSWGVAGTQSSSAS
jgi:hypothetical protein